MSSNVVVLTYFCNMALTFFSNGSSYPHMISLTDSFIKRLLSSPQSNTSSTSSWIQEYSLLMISAMVWNQQILFRLLCPAIINRVTQKADTDDVRLHRYHIPVQWNTSTTKCKGFIIKARQFIMSVKYQFIISVFDIIVFYCTYIEDAEDLNRQCFNILSHFTSLQRISFTEQILKIDNNTSEFCKQILICLHWFRLWKYMHCIYWQYIGAKNKELIFIQKVCAYHLSDFRYLSKFQIICYLYAHF